MEKSKNARQKVIQLNTGLDCVTGIQRVLMDIHAALKDDFDTKIFGTVPYESVDKDLGVSAEEYVEWSKNPIQMRDAIVIVHERRLLPLMWLYSHIPGLNMKYVYVHHSMLYGQKILSRFPKHVVAISDAGIRNLTEYFGVDEKRITKIHNCVREAEQIIRQKRDLDPSNIKILYPGRINKGKRQIEIINRLRGQLDSRVKILFAGVGPDYEEFKDLCIGDTQFVSLGFRNDVERLMCDNDFVMLFSEFEGLPISLIEAAKTGTPVICNDVGGNLEIVEPDVSGIVVNTWEDLLSTLNSLPDMDADKLKDMSTAARKIYEERFNFDRFKSQYVGLIKSMTGK